MIAAWGREMRDSPKLPAEATCGLTVQPRPHQHLRQGYRRAIPEGRPHVRYTDQRAQVARRMGEGRGYGA